MTAHDWRITEVTKVTDGDTIRAHITRTEPLVTGWAHDIHDEPVPGEPAGAPLRLIIIDTPERGHIDYVRARDDLAIWILTHLSKLRVETYEHAGWDRGLADIYVEGDRGNTATQWMLLRGWPIYEGKP